ncbi:MAG: amidohydrolase family protein [Hyphomicrobiaceae bacterium]|nr:amidohydrolase family protein [Hyphomicrobiaceae bacterium]
MNEHKESVMTVERQSSRHIPVRPEWLASRQEAALEPELPIVDPHHHLWDVPIRPQRYFLDEFNADVASGHNIVSTVFIECHAMYRPTGPEAMRPVGEIEFANGQAAISASGHYGKTRVADGIVGFAPLGIGTAVGEVLEAMVRVAGPRFKGVRNISAWHKDPAARGSSANPPPDVLTNPKLIDGLKVLTRMGLAFDAWMYHTQLAEIVAVARAVPDATIVLDHCGGTIGIGPYEARRAETMAEWRGLMKDVATCPNIRVKIGGLGMRLFGFDVHEGELPPSSEQLAAAWRPHVETCIELFGARRCMLESNFPVDKGSCSYGNLWNAFKRITAGASAEEKDWLYRRCAAETYKLAA